jgi:hypothetical protein
VSERWESPAEVPTTPEHLAAERQLALVDRLIGLEAENAQLAVSTALAPSEQLRVEQQIARMRASFEWRVGRVVTAPFRALRGRLVK